MWMNAQFSDSAVRNAKIPSVVLNALVMTAISSRQISDLARPKVNKFNFNPNN